jgi:hypothetical protein
MAYGATRAEAVARVQALGLCVLAERIEHGETCRRFSRFSPLRQHEPVDFREGVSRLSGAAADWVEH